MQALIGMYRGCEINFAYRRKGSSVERVGQRNLLAPTVGVLAEDAIHSVANPGEAPSGALHIYLGDLTRQQRSMWTPDLRVEQPFDYQIYLANARPLTSAESLDP
jgi:predicted metal-dependent enzyme (double-stranded beta helix superfamily)